MIHVEEYKRLSQVRSSEVFFSAKTLYVPFSQHTGRPSRPLVKPGDTVSEGDLLAEADGFISTTLSAPASGKVTAIETINHPALGRAPACIIQCQGSEKEYSFQDYTSSFEKEAALEIITRSGIVGMGGACFPAQVKLNPPKKVDTVIINGCECEPYLACDYRLMLERAEGIFRGAEIICRLLSPRRVIFAIEDNKPEAIKKFNLLVSTRKFPLPSPSIAVLKTAYPQGSEKQLIHRCTGRKVPSGKLPFDVACCVHNVATCFAIFEAFFYKKPLTQRLVTFAGDALREPKNIWVKIGTMISDLFREGVLAYSQEPSKIIYGGPMMGLPLAGIDYPILKGTSGVLFLTKKSVSIAQETNCIRCARCVDVCPMELYPLEFVKRIKREEFDRLNDFAISDCIECGCCAYVCPAKIPLVHYIKIGKRYMPKT